ncbi:hypothetical protein [Georgenia wangjunii]|uniref:hypothetical protein n=1 Tax=Georgenia wangjunii TaxID=3117730 RepID=UPI002F263335
MSVEPTPETGIEPTTDVEELAPTEDAAAAPEDYEPPAEVSADSDGSEGDKLEQSLEVPLDEDDEVPS